MTGVIILAAGASSRMGQPKQILIYQQQTLLYRAVQAAVKLVNTYVIVVVGANQAVVITPELSNASITIVHNPDWQQGMASSVSAGIKRLIAEHPTVQNVLLMLCDQPFVDTMLLQKLIDAKEANNGHIIASAYQNTEGAPVLFDRKYVPELMALKGQEGAKKLLGKYKNEVISVPFEQGAIDIDTPEDYKRLVNS
ncbi:nucleotidyltransferase family protein [Mucilaginibacter sp. CSA2-8R]|uniref:nucleotidyltransferase family protein n=1 Tax=Mucilaginibacter sp. CSA2-8R TaxID=3141542 RepID=UPI00315CDB07